jgi:hypothetical protein
VIVQFRELSIGEMLADPIVRAVMFADGVDADELELMLQSIAERMSQRSRATAASQPLLAFHHRRSATSDQTASTSPNGHAP